LLGLAPGFRRGLTRKSDGNAPHEA
jgi:hypothetical protein